MKVFPCRDKKPLLAGWQLAATDAPAAVEAWYDAYGDDIQLGVPTGAANGVTVLDIDAPEGWETLEKLELGLDSWASCHQTYFTQSGGAHVFCAYVPGLRNSAGKLGPGLDIRGEGGYVIAYDPDNAEAALARELPELPKVLLDLLMVDSKPSTINQRPGDVVEGGRNQYLASLGGRLQKQGLLTLEGLQALNERDCLPPLGPAEVRTIFDSMGRYEPEAAAIPEKPPELIWARALQKPMLDYLGDKSLVKGMATGMEALDRLLGGGKRLGELTVTLAEAKTGKNTLWHQLLVGWLNTGVKVGYASRELSPEEEVLPNLLSVAYLQNMLKAKAYDEERISATLGGWQLAFAEGYGAMEGESLFTWMDMCREAGIQYFFIDHLHYLLEDPEEFKHISKLIRRIKSYAKANKVHIDLIVQPKITEPGARLNINSMRGGASIGQALDNLFTLQRVRDESGRKTNVVQICLEAARHKLANLGDFYLRYDVETMTFIEVVPDTAPQGPPRPGLVETMDDGPVHDRGQNAQWNGRQIQ